LTCPLSRSVVAGIHEKEFHGRAGGALALDCELTCLTIVSTFVAAGRR